MAKKIFEIEELVLQDDTKVVVKPLVLKKLRDFMEVFKKLEKIKTDDDAMEVLKEAAEVVLKAYAPQLLEDDKDGDKLYESVLDLPTMNRMLEVAGGIKLGDVEGNPLAQAGTT